MQSPSEAPLRISQPIILSSESNLIFHSQVLTSGFETWPSTWRWTPLTPNDSENIVLCKFAVAPKRCKKLICYCSLLQKQFLQCEPVYVRSESGLTQQLKPCYFTNIMNIKLLAELCTLVKKTSIRPNLSWLLCQCFAIFHPLNPQGFCPEVKQHKCVTEVEAGYNRTRGTRWWVPEPNLCGFWTYEGTRFM